MTTYFGTSGDDTFPGGATSDDYSLTQGGNDTVSSGSGNDNFYFDAALNADDRINGGPGSDNVFLEGDYSAGLALGATTLTNIEHLALGGSFGYAISFVAETVRPGATLLVDNPFGALGHVALDNSASAAGAAMTVRLAASAIDFIGGEAVERIEITAGAGRVLDADLGAGDDVVLLNNGFWGATEHLDGGDGVDTLFVSTNNSPLIRLNLTGSKVSGFEDIQLSGSAAYDLKIANDVVGGGDALVELIGTPGQGSSVDASKVAAGQVHLVGNYTDDTLIGGRGADTLEGGGGANVLIGGGGADEIHCTSAAEDAVVYLSVRDSTKRAADLVFIGNGAIDVSAIDADTGSSGDQAFTVVAQFSHHAGEITVSYKAKTDLTYINLDVDGDGKADGVITLSGDHHDFSDFVL